MLVKVKEGSSRYNYRDAKTHPDYKRAVKVGSGLYPHMKFPSEGARKDYIRAVESNPNNVMGLTPFHPPMRTGISLSGISLGSSTMDGVLFPCGKKYSYSVVRRGGDVIYKCKCVVGHEVLGSEN